MHPLKGAPRLSILFVFVASEGSGNTRADEGKDRKQRWRGPLSCGSGNDRAFGHDCPAAARAVDQGRRAFRLPVAYSLVAELEPPG